MPRFVNVSLAVLAIAAATPAWAQPSGGVATQTAPTPAPPSPPPPATTNPPPAATNPPTVTLPPPETVPETPPEPVNQPVQQAAPPPPAPIELSPTEPYPNGLADPGDNVFQADNDRGGDGFPWGLLGLLGLLGLIPWLRGGPKTIYVERERPPGPGEPRA
jgi:hypothetical protein